MTTQDRKSPGGTAYVVLDIETAPDPRPLVRASSGSAERSTHSHVVKAAAILCARRCEDADWVVLSVNSWHRPGDEHAVLSDLQRNLATELDGGATLVTFNGRQHDVPTIRIRAAFHRMFGLRAWQLLTTAPHRDLMTDGIAGHRAKRASLSQICAGLGIPSDHAFPAAARGTADVVRRKCETDVCATFALLLYTIAMETGDARDLTEGWRALATLVEREHAREPHLLQFAHAGYDQCVIDSGGYTETYDLERSHILSHPIKGCRDLGAIDVKWCQRRHQARAQEIVVTH